MQQGVGAMAGLGEYLPRVEAALRDIHDRDAVKRVWAKDHTLWKPDPTEITDRLGWLTVTGAMRGQLARLEGLAEEIRGAGYRHVVVAGMGGSVFGPEALRQIIGSGLGCPELIVLDSTVPAWARAVIQRIDPRRTLFLISSKSGGTLETLCFYRRFRTLVEESVGRAAAGDRFVAITDPGTPLERLAQEQGFREALLNPEDVGGRYSVLSLFGLAPAVLTGIDAARLMDRADAMRERCGPDVPARENAGAWLGAVMGSLALAGCDKLTLVTSPAVESFGLWVEQMLSESLGKEGKGVVPVAGEPPAAPERYGGDRLFVFLRLRDDDNAAVDARMKAIAASGRPWLRLEMEDRYDLGAEFYRWGFATAVAGALLGVHPFDQPNVQQAKDMTNAALAEYRATGRLPRGEAGPSPSEMLAEAKAGNYASIMVYALRTPEMDRALCILRRRILERHGLPVAMGYGPRYLHSTGQMHKGGPATGLYLQITTGHGHDLEIPGEDFSFGTLADAQALADLKALRALGRPVAGIHLDAVDEASLNRLAETPV